MLYSSQYLLKECLHHGILEPEKDVSKPHQPKKIVPRPGPVFTKKENATLSQRIEILDWYYNNGKNQSKMACHFQPKYPNLKIEQPLVSAWLRDKAKWREEWRSCNGATMRNAKRAWQMQHLEVTEMLDLWVLKAMHDKILLTGDVLRAKWKQFADIAGVPDDEWLELSEGWLTRLVICLARLQAVSQPGQASGSQAESSHQIGLKWLTALAWIL